MYIYIYIYIHPGTRVAIGGIVWFGGLNIGYRSSTPSSSSSLNTRPHIIPEQSKSFLLVYLPPAMILSLPFHLSASGRPKLVHKHTCTYIHTGCRNSKIWPYLKHDTVAGMHGTGGCGKVSITVIRDFLIPDVPCTASRPPGKTDIRLEQTG